MYFFYKEGLFPLALNSASNGKARNRYVIKYRTREEEEITKGTRNIMSAIFITSLKGWLLGQAIVNGCFIDRMPDIYIMAMDG